MQIVRMPGILERRPRATAIASGNAAAMLSTVSMKVSGRPPQLSELTVDRPSTPPRWNTKNSVRPTTQITTIALFQNRGMHDSTMVANSAAIAISERHCSS